MIKKFGDWNKVESLVRNLDTMLKKANHQALQKITKEAEKRVIDHLDNQDLSWEPLSASYKNDKVRKGLSNGILIASQDFRNAITSIITSDTGFVGIPKGKRNREGEELEIIAAVHEFGSEKRNIPKRQLWGPTLEEVSLWIRSNNIPEQEVEKEFKKRGLEVGKRGGVFYRNSQGNKVYVKR
ncbi:MAG: hypothetical protein MUC49_15810 [Raineya sp.]|nr:hypothetical protein [Raineya sp.]